jgi:FkbM family methyltransferase
MLQILKTINRPEYLWQPRKLLARLQKSQPTTERQVVALPWGLPIEVDPREAIGRAIVHHGLFDISITEALYRLVEAGDVVLDVGANIGFMTSVAIASQRTAQVVSFEPHPTLFERLARNRALWCKEWSDVQSRLCIEQVALSDTVGVAELHVPTSFQSNQGISSLESISDEDEYARVSVRTTTLDQYFAGRQQSVGVLKIDVEGHELSAFSGAASMLRAGCIRDILFEDHVGFASDVCQLLSGVGYTILALGKLPWRPILVDRSSVGLVPAISSDSPNFLATRDPHRAKALMAPFGYRCARSKA